MIEAYNFTGSWQLFPEKGVYENGQRPVSGIFKLEAGKSKKEIVISPSWVSLENQAFSFEYSVQADGDEAPFADQQFADTVSAQFTDALTLLVNFKKNNLQVLSVQHELQANGHLKIIQQIFDQQQKITTKEEVYHRQLSVVPYAASVSGAVIKATEEGVIRHKALTAMEEQTNMQLEQIRKQIELLALQAKEIQLRKDLSMKIYNAKLSFNPVIGKTYFLYEKRDESYILSLISPKEYGNSAGPYKAFVAPVKLLADHTWVEI
ncbi:MAG: hypothetical protein RL172_1895 [Bacteroidota bacterium]